MLSRFSVKKPFYVLVAVIIVLVLGGISLEKMKTDLLPEFDIPYLAVITTDVGASPEQVEKEVSDVLESSLATVTGVSNVQAMSGESYSMIFLEFADGTDMDAALVKVSGAVNEVSDQLPDSAGTPTYMEISMDMMATMYVGVTDDSMSLASLTEFVEDKVVPSLERQEGVADVAVAGSVVNTISIELNQYKIDLVNDGILGNVNSQLASSKAQLDAASRQLDDAEAQVAEQQAQFQTAKDGVISAEQNLDQLKATEATLESTKSALEYQISTLPEGEEKEAAKQKLAIVEQNLASVQEAIKSTSTPIGTTITLVEAQEQLDSAASTISSSRSQIESGYSQLESARSQAASQANIGAMLDASTLSQLISAQNFEMPAGYVDNGDDTQWMVKVGQEYTSADELRDMVLTTIDGVGDITLGDVADVVTTDNVGSTYANMNGSDALVLSITKSPTANTGEVSDVVNKQMDKLEQENESLDLIKVMDQGDYIDLYIWTILKSLLLGALLAVIVLAVFLRDIKPTLIVAFSIPFSVLFAIVIMYFTGLELNIMTLGAMSLSIGMLVDNSIVVMENIYRLRGRGMDAPRAAAQGARQVAGAVIASTLTTVCVFLPMVFTTGTVRQLLVPFALTLSYVLIASLVVALTVVPALGSKLFKRGSAESRAGFTKVQDAYGGALAWCLDHKLPVLALALVLLVGSAACVANMGIVLLPDMASNQLMLTLEMPEDMEQEDAYAIVDEAVKIIGEQEGVADVGSVDSGFTAGMMTSAASETDTYDGTFIVYAMVDKDTIKTEKQMKELSAEVVESCEGLNCTVYSSDSMEGMSSLLSSGLTVEVKGTSLEEVQKLSDQVVETVKGIEGYEEVTNGQEDADETLHIYIDRNEVARMGTTVAQIYASLAADLSDTTTAFTMNSDGGESMDVNIETGKYLNITKDNLMDWEFEDSSGSKHKLSEVATIQSEEGLQSITRINSTYSMSVTADIADGYNTTLLSRQLQPELDKIDVPSGCSIDIGGNDEDIADMLRQMLELMVVGFLLIYLVMVAQFQSLLSPFIIIFTVPLAFTGGLLALLITGEQLSVMSLLGFVILMGTVVNNGIVFVDYANQLRLGGMAKRPALIATGKTRMRPIMMTALTTILSMCALIFSQDIGAGMERGMALVVAGGLLYATFMTLFVVPAIYDLFSRKPLHAIDLGRDIDEDANDAEEFIALMGEEARETYEYESARDRRRRIRMEGGAHGKTHLRNEYGASDDDNSGDGDAAE